ncbi:MAG: helix-turn-helix transcriptional regulator [Bacteroidota bacterium]
MKDISIRKINTTPQELNLSESFSIRDIQSLLAGNDMIQELHRHDFFYILALEKGLGRHEIDFIPYEVNDYCIFFMKPGQVHQLELKANCTGFLVEFDASFYYPDESVSNQRLKKASSKNLCRLEVNRFEKILSILTYIFQEFTTKQTGYIEIIKANLGIFFIEFVRQSKDPSNISVNSNSYAQERLEDFLELLNIHILTKKQVSHYADLLNLSQYQLNAITKSTLNKTCSELINEQIILESKRQLLATSKQVNQIAFHLGYDDVSYFIRFFKKHTGHSPEVFRDNYK